MLGDITLTTGQAWWLWATGAMVGGFIVAAYFALTHAPVDDQPKEPLPTLPERQGRLKLEEYGRPARHSHVRILHGRPFDFDQDA